MKARYASSGEGVGELKAVEIEKGSLAKKAKKEDIPTSMTPTPINLITPLKARYTSSGYLKDLDAISIPVSKQSECPEGSVKKDGKCVPINDGKVNQKQTSTSQL